MDPDLLASSIKKAQPRTVRFKPKAVTKREPKLVLPVVKNENDLDDTKSEELLNKLNDMNLKKPKFEKKSQTLDVGVLSSYAAHKHKKNQGSSSNGAGDEGHTLKEYKEPWDYYTNYPVTLPMRRPYSGNPELLDEEEFGPESSAYDENETNTAEELGLLDENVEDNKLFIQLPSTLPAIGQSEVHDANPAKGSGTSKSPCGVGSLPAGLIGKLLVYRSGKVKMKLGDMLFDVSLGLDCTFAQDVVAINPESKHCFNLGELNKRAVVTPDIDSMLDSVDDDDL